uniref:Uncharacterized protein n=1 Tax=Alexandrium catenella TaxID=2925 RepID=A0A7S1LL98_ALECA
MLPSVTASTMNFTVFSRPVKLRYGEVHNKMQEPMRLPQEVIARYADGKSAMAISGFDVDMVRRAPDGRESRVKLDDHYLHHYALSMADAPTMSKMLSAASEDAMFARMLSGCHAMTRSGIHNFNNKLWLESRGKGRRMATLGSAAGAEYRDNLQRFDRPFRAVLLRPEVWAPLLHIINMKESRSQTPWSPLLECPCTPQRRIDVAAGTIDGRHPEPPIKCSKEFAATGNPSCHLATYVGGWRCCEHHMFLIDTDKECEHPDCRERPADEVFMKFTFFYEDAVQGVIPVEPAACCDVTSTTQGGENIEYDIPACAPGTPPERCLHVAETVQPVAYYDQHPKSPFEDHKGSDMVHLVFAAPHLHVAGLSLQLFDNTTNKLLCEVHAVKDNSGGVTYGHGHAAGDEDGYMVGLSTCRWDGAHAPQFRRDHPLRMRAVYNASMYHTGVMSLWLMNVAPVNEPDILV